MRQGDLRPGYSRSLGKRLQAVLFVDVFAMSEDDMIHRRQRPAQPILWGPMVVRWRRVYGRPIKIETLRRRYYNGCRDARLRPWREWALQQLLFVGHFNAYLKQYEHAIVGFWLPWVLGGISRGEAAAFGKRYPLRPICLPQPLCLPQHVELLASMLRGELPPLTSLLSANQPSHGEARLHWFPKLGPILVRPEPSDREAHLSWLLRVLRQLESLAKGRAEGEQVLAVSPRRRANVDRQRSVSAGSSGTESREGH